MGDIILISSVRKVLLPRESSWATLPTCIEILFEAECCGTSQAAPKWLWLPFACASWHGNSSDLRSASRTCLHLIRWREYLRGTGTSNGWHDAKRFEKNSCIINTSRNDISVLVQWCLEQTPTTLALPRIATTTAIAVCTRAAPLRYHMEPSQRSPFSGRLDSSRDQW